MKKEIKLSLTRRLDAAVVIARLSLSAATSVAITAAISENWHCGGSSTSDFSDADVGSVRVSLF